MELEALYTLLLEEDLELEWLCSKVDDRDCFYCPLVIPTDTLVFCFIPLLDKQPYVAYLSSMDMQVQSREQGYLESSIGQIHAGLCQQTSDPSSALRFRRNNSSIELSIHLSRVLELSLKANILVEDPRISSILLKRLLGDLLTGTYLLERLSFSRLKLLESKDRAIEFLRDNLEELGDKQVLSKWAPKGSLNYQALKVHDESEEKTTMFARVEETLGSEGISKQAQASDLLLRLKRELKQYKGPRLGSPRVSKATKQPSDFASISEPDELSNTETGTHNAATKLENVPSLVKDETPIPGDSPSSGRESSKSPSKKRKFRRVKITKQSSV